MNIQVMSAPLIVALVSSALLSEELPAPKESQTQLDTTSKSYASYAIGMTVGANLKSNGLETNLFDKDAFLRGILDVLEDVPPRIQAEKLAQAMQAFDAVVAAKRAALADKNKSAGGAFLAANQAKPGIKTLPSGLQYKVLKAGEGASPTLTDRVRTHYVGRLIDGTVFDSSIERNEPAEFPVSGVIRGWMEALPRMKVGDKWELFVPSNLAYGPRGAGGVIGPNAVLIFEIELLGIIDEQP
jgi:FKBP-type peptidyl-prolyl cis-trans isomerase FklB